MSKKFVPDQLVDDQMREFIEYMSDRRDAWNDLYEAICILSNQSGDYSSFETRLMVEHFTSNPGLLNAMKLVLIGKRDYDDGGNWLKETVMDGRTTRRDGGIYDRLLESALNSVDWYQVAEAILENETEATS